MLYIISNFSLFVQNNTHKSAINKNSKTVKNKLHGIKKNFLKWIIFKVFVEFVTALLLLFIFWFFGHDAGGILAPDQGSNMHPLQEKAKSKPLDHQRILMHGI